MPLESGCGAAVEPQFPNTSFVPYSDQLSKPPTFPIAVTGTILDRPPETLASGVKPLLPATIGDAPLQLLQSNQNEDYDGDGKGDTQLWAFYGSAALSPSSTLPEYWAAAGLLLVQHQRGFFHIASDAAGLGGRAVLVKIGAFDGFIVHGDPVSDDVRPYGVYWTDGSRDMWLSGIANPTQLIDMARALECNSGG